MRPEELIEKKSKINFHQNHPVLDFLDFGDVRDLMEEYAEQQERKAFEAGRELHPDKFAERKYKTFEQYKSQKP